MASLFEPITEEKKSLFEPIENGADAFKQSLFEPISDKPSLFEPISLSQQNGEDVLDKIIAAEKKKVEEAHFKPTPQAEANLQQAIQHPVRSLFQPLSVTAGGESVQEVANASPTAKPAGTFLGDAEYFARGVGAGVADMVQTPVNYIPIPGAKYLGKIPVAGTTLGEIATKAKIGKGFAQDVKYLAAAGKAAQGGVVMPELNAVAEKIIKAGGGEPMKSAKGSIMSGAPQEGKFEAIGAKVLFNDPDPRFQSTMALPIEDLSPQNVAKAIANKRKEIIEGQNFNPDKYVAEQVVKRESARNQDEILGTNENLTKFYKEAKSKLVDFAAPIEDVLRTAQKKGKYIVRPEAHITNQIDRVLRAPTIAGQFAKDNGLVDVIKNVDNLNNLDQYMIAKHAQTVKTNGIKTGRNSIADAKLVEAFAPRYEKYAQVVTNYSRKLLDYSVDSGLINKELADTLKIKYPNYVPLNRIFTELEKVGGGGGSKAIASLSRQTIVQRLKGSDREVESPVASLLLKTNDAFKQGEKNKAAQMLVNYKDLPDNPFQIKEIKPKIVPVGVVTHKAAVDAAYVKKVGDLAQSLGAKVITTGQPGRALGYFHHAGNVIERKFSTPEEVISHEAGHFFDKKYGLKKRFYRRGVNKPIGDEMMKFVEDQGQSVSRANSPSERFAHSFEWWLSNRALAEKDIPLFSAKIKQIIAETPELKPLIDIRPTPGLSLERMKETVYGPSAFEPKEPHISVLVKGEKKFFATTPEVAQAAKSLGVQELNVLGKIFALPVRIARVGITGINTPFVAANIAKDQVTGIINSKNALRTSIANPAVFFKALTEAVGHGKVYEEMARQGALGTSFDISRNQPLLTIGKIRSGRSVPAKIAYTVRHPGELLRAVENIIGRSEELTRIQQFEGTKRAMLAKGMSMNGANIEAARAARENTVNFARRGEWGTVLNSAFLYINANIQGTRTFVRNFSERPAATVTKMALVVFTPVAIATAWNLSDPKRKAAYEDIGEADKENNIIIIPPDPVKRPDGTWNVIKIPLSQEINNIAGLARKPIEQAYNLDPMVANDIIKAFAGTISPINPTVNSAISTLTPQAIKPTLEAVTNKNFFFGSKIVPQSLERLSPELQVKPHTSGTARQIGKILHASPLKVEAFINGTFGGVSSQVLHASDIVLAGFNIIPRDQIGGKSVIKAITDRFTSVRGGHLDDKANEELQKIIQRHADDSFRLKQEAEILYADLKNRPPAEANKIALGIKKVNPSKFEKLKDVISAEKKNLDYNDRLMLQLPIGNGNRALFIWKNLKAFKTTQDKNAYIASLKAKGIVSDKVMEQLKYFKNNNIPSLP